MLRPLEDEVPSQVREADQDVASMPCQAGLVVRRRGFQSTRNLPVVQGHTLLSSRKTSLAATLCTCEKFPDGLLLRLYGRVVDSSVVSLERIEILIDLAR